MLKIVHDYVDVKWPPGTSYFKSDLDTSNRTRTITDPCSSHGLYQNELATLNFTQHYLNSVF